MATKDVRPSTSWIEKPWLMPTVDAVLAFAAFGIAYFVRYELQLIAPVLAAVSSLINKT